MAAVSRQEVAEKVPLTRENAGRCRCPECPVQAESKCVRGLKERLFDALEEATLKREKIPGVYCSTGKATCSDLDQKKNCICTTCGVFDRCRLAKGKPVGHYCRDGSSSPA